MALWHLSVQFGLVCQQQAGERQTESKSEIERDFSPAFTLPGDIVFKFELNFASITINDDVAD